MADTRSYSKGRTSINGPIDAVPLASERVLNVKEIEIATEQSSHLARKLSVYYKKRKEAFSNSNHEG